MRVIENATRKHFSLPGIDHQTLVNRDDGIAGLEVWYQVLGPNAATPVHYHECEEVIVVLKGSGRAIVDGEERHFGPNSTVVFPARMVHQLINSAEGQMVLMVSLSASPARVFAPDGTEIPVPWIS